MDSGHMSAEPFGSQELLKEEQGVDGGSEQLVWS